MKASKKKIVFFTPHAGIWPHALPESFLAKCLDDDKFEIARISCDRVFNSHCTVMEAFRIAPESDAEKKETACKNCIANSRILRSSYRGRDLRINEYLTAEDREEAEKAAGRLTRENIHAFSHFGVEVGKIASYEILLKYKKTSLTFADAEFAHYRIYVKNALLALMAFRRFYDEWHPDIMLSYSPQYGVNGACARYCELQGTRSYLMEGSSNIKERYKAMRIWDWTAFGLTNPALKYWRGVDQSGITPKDIERAAGHKDFLLKAQSFSVYSEPVTNLFDLRAHFKVPAGAKVLLASMSSYDEVFSAYVIDRFPPNKYLSPVFSTQLDWIKATIPFFASHPELFLIIRIHPRTFPNKRENVMASEHGVLADLLADLPPNVRANFPADKISIYDLYGQIDALVTGWSATGVEAMTYGVPVVTYDRNLPSYPASIHYTGDSREEYFENLSKAASAGRSEKVKDGGYGWMAFSMSIGVITHPNPLGSMEIVSTNKIVKFIYRVLNRLAPRMLKKMESFRSMRDKQAVRRFNTLLDTGARSLYDSPTRPAHPG